MTPIKFAAPDFAELAENLDCRLEFDETAASRPAATLPAARRLTRKPARRFMDLREHADAARRLLTPLPKSGESVHVITSGEFVLAAVVPAMLDALGPCSLCVSSLGTNQQTASMFADLLREGRLTRLDMVLSHYFSKADRETCDLVCQIIREAGGRIAVTRSHTKLALFEPQSRQDRYCFEGSGNLRSSQNAEQLTISNDDQLFKFYHTWFNEMFK